MNHDFIKKIVRIADQILKMDASARELSRLLFGNSDRLEVGLYIASVESGVVSTPEVGRDLQIAQNRIRAQLLAFVQMGLLEVMPRPGSRTIFYLRRNDTAWQALRALIDSLRKIQTGEAGQEFRVQIPSHDPRIYHRVVTKDRADAIALEVRADLKDLDALPVSTTIFDSARTRFEGTRYGSEVATMLANLYARHVELALVVCESFLVGRRTTGFVAVRPIFETAMTLAWIAVSSDDPNDQYSRLLTLLDRDAVQLACRLRSRKPGVVQRAKEDLEDRDQYGRESVEEAIAVGSRNLPGLRIRIEEAEEVFRETLGGPSRLADAYEDYRVLSGYGHPTGDGNRFEVDEMGTLREKSPDVAIPTPMLILLREMPLLLLTLTEVAGWEQGVQIGKGMDDVWRLARQKLLESYKGILPDIVLQIWGWRAGLATTSLEAEGRKE